MSVKSVLARPFANVIQRRVMTWSRDAARAQEFWFHKLVIEGKRTFFGKEHHFENIMSHDEYVKQVPLHEYEEFIPYIDRIKAGEEDILWKGKPIYFAKSSGTTAGIKYIPISKESISNHQIGPESLEDHHR